MIKKLPPYFIAFFFAWLYSRTLAPGLTWAYDGADGGDFLSAIATGGVPHPGGYPTYLFFTSFFVRLPFGSLAFRINLFSSVCMVLAVLALYKLVFILSGDRVAASIVAVLFGTFPLVWSQALITEIYALQALLIFLVLLFFMPKMSTPHRDFLGGLTMGLALGNHLTAIFLFPFMFLNNTYQTVADAAILHLPFKRYVQPIGKRIAGFLVGLSVYLTIPLRAQTQPPVNWGNAVDWDGFWWLVSGEMYHGRLSHFSPEYLLFALRLWSGFVLDQLGIISLAVGLIFFIVTFKSNRLYLMTGWLFLVYSLFSIIYYSPDSYVYLIPALASFAIWIGLGIKFVIGKLPSGLSRLKPAIMLLLFAVIAFRAITMIPDMDLSGDRSAEEYAETVLLNLPEDAIVVADGDEALFSLWYFHFALGRRSDVAVISKGLLGQSWYHDVLKSSYPELNIPDSPWPQDFATINSERSLCLLDRDLQPRFECQ